MKALGATWRERLAYLRAHPSARLRAIGTLVLAGGMLAAMIVYLVALGSAETAPFDPDEGHSRSADRQAQALMGNWVTLTSGWSEAATSPIGKSVGVMAVSALFAAYFFRVASVIDFENADPPVPPEPPPI
jgi:hypothetical protein